MKKNLQFKTMMKSLMALSIFLVGSLVIMAQGATFTSVNPTTDVVTISNTGSTMVDVTDYWLCLGPGTYQRIGAITPESGSYMLAPGNAIVLSYNMDEMADGLSLFSTNSFSSSDPTILTSYVQWGAPNQPRVNQAVNAGRWDNASNFVTGNGPYSTMNGGSAAAWSSCMVEGGEIQIAGTTDTATTICVGEGFDDLIDVEFVDMSVLSGDSSTWVITDQATGDILGAPASGPFNLEGAPTGVCDIWYLRYTGDIGLATATNVADLSGCFDLSNPISVSRNAVNGGEIQIAGTTDTTAEICVGEGTTDLIEVEFVDMSVLSGDSSTWVITDQATGDILGAPASGPFNLEGAPTGVCDIWYLRYTGDIGLATATNVADLSGCFDLSNPISVSRNAVNGGEIQIAGTTDTETTICVGEGTTDLIEVEFVDMSVLSGDSATWVITDQATGDILGAPASGPFNLEGAPTGVCDIWYLRYTGDIGLATATNVADLSGCFDLSNPISVSRNAVNGGEIQIAGTTDTETTICVGEGTTDLIEVEFVDMSVLSGDSATWVITDQATGDILGAPASGPFNLEGAPTGVCDIWYLRYTGDIGLATATNVADLSGCFDLSNPISVSRNAVNGGEIQIAGTTDTETTICVGEGFDDLIEVEFVDMSVLSGDSSTWVITDQATGDILGAPASGPFNLEGAPTGVCDIWYLRYTGDIGLATATNVADLSGCFDLSNPISVSRNAVNGGEIQIAGTTDTTAEICVGEGTTDLIEVEFVDMSVLSGDSATWVITDQATGDILGAPASGPFNLEGAPTGVCDIWYLRYTGDIGLATATNVADLSGCFDLSNPISVSRNAVNGGEIQIAGTTDTTAEICVGEGTTDLIEVEFVDMSVLSGDSATWVITDQATGDILGAPASGPFNLEGAPAGVCDIWYLRYTGDIGLATATNVSDLSGCFDLSNPISVTRFTGVDCDALSVDDFSSDFDFNLYPNPTKDSVNLLFNGNRALDLSIQVIDLLGKQVYKTSLSSQSQMSVDMSNFENGTYFINITDLETGISSVKRIIKN